MRRRSIIQASYPNYVVVTTNVDVDNFPVYINNIKYSRKCLSNSPTKIYIKSKDPILSANKFIDGLNNNYSKTTLTKIDLSNLDLSSCTSLDRAFCMNDTLETIDFGNNDISQVTRMSGTFMSCPELKTVNISKCNFNTSKVIYFDRAFSYVNINNIQEIINKITLDSCINTSEMFYGSDYEILDLSKWDFSNVTRMSGMFEHCTKLKAIPTLKNTKNVTNINYMFQDCISLPESAFTNGLPFDTSSVTQAMNCIEGSQIQEINLQSNTLINLTSANILWNCPNLTTIKLPKIGHTDSTVSWNSAFSGCKNLTYIDLQDSPVPSGTGSSMFLSVPSGVTIKCTSAFKSWIESNRYYNKAPFGINYQII